MGVKRQFREWTQRKFQEIGFLVGSGAEEIDWRRKSSTVSVLRERSLVDSADFFEARVGELTLLETTEEMHQRGASSIIPALPEVLFLEFGT